MSCNCIFNTKDVVILEKTQSWAVNKPIPVLIGHYLPSFYVSMVLGVGPMVTCILGKPWTTQLHSLLLNQHKSQFPSRKWDNNSNWLGLYEHQRREQIVTCSVTKDIDIQMLMSAIGITITFDERFQWVYLHAH